MTKGTFKKFAALLVAGTMVAGSSVTAFADAGVGEGTGTYEGGEMKYPTLSITLPTIPAGTYDYIADPNGLIEATKAAAHSGATFSGDSGIFFQTEANKYSEKSAAQEVTNENAQDIDITVKLEQKTAGNEGIAYADTATFEDEDKDKKLYLAITDDAESNPVSAALSSDAAAVITTKVAGKKDNFEPGWTSGEGYSYALKTGDLEWNKCSFILTGALNTNATWEDNLVFPEIKVTWSYKEHVDGPVATPGSMSTSAKSAVISGLADGVTLKSAKVIKADNSAINLAASTQYTYSNNTFAIVNGKEVLLDSTKYQKFVLTYSDDSEVEIPIVAAD